ncbi:chitinase-like protein 1 [Phtheirospermum japonicum]|uniref:Chitinase-like protein 1 n=1 Tax=Phtheirospermum japonicum TaxID=374723 RepID=A0A830D9F3_9LAMI|nr:chitinase-like protein 1 [Phtheirospermum japonicum]
MAGLAVWAIIISAICLSVGADPEKEIIVKKVKGKKVCTQGWECKTPSPFCCNQTISDFFQTYQFESLFSKRNTPVANAVGFWDYRSFITASTEYQPLGFGTTGGKTMQMKEVAAFLAHVGSKTSCGYGVATGGPLAWGLCFNKELSPSQIYCDDSWKYDFPCAPGADYRGRGAIPIYWNYNYGLIGRAINVDLLNHPEYIEQNATLAFQAAIHSWMTRPNRIIPNRIIPSAHEVFVGNWKPTKNDTLAKRVPGFGTTINVMYGDLACGQGDVDSMNNIISHYLYYLDLMGVGRYEAGPHEVLSCAEQVPFTKSPTTTTSSS